LSEPVGIRSPLAALLVLVSLSACGPGESTAIPVAHEPPVNAQDELLVNPDPAATTVDAASGLIIDDHWELVRGHCGACHSTQLVTQNRGSRDHWLQLIRWMQESQGLWAFDAETENSILDYLEKNYPPTTRYRRAPIAPELMPET
jgi:hypothetical protein